MPLLTATEGVASMKPQLRLRLGCAIDTAKTTRKMNQLTTKLMVFMTFATPLVAAQADALPTPSERFGDPGSGEVPSFRKHIVPLLGVRGCNGRECHGSFAGKGDFQLSLFGYDFDKDHKEIVKDEDEIRVDKSNPANSLLLLKPTM